MTLAAAMTLYAAGKNDGVLRFDETRYDFGRINEDTHGPVVHEYTFTNVSDQPVAILSVSTECGCTRPEYPLKPIAPGQSAAIKVTFDPKGYPGNAEKSIKVRYRAAKAKSSKRTTLKLVGFVKRNRFDK